MENHETSNCQAGFFVFRFGNETGGEAVIAEQR
jgi:hypothetical protein